jgi:SNF2 family DNA or RNA helicase
MLWAFDLTDPKQFQEFMTCTSEYPAVGVINYDLIWRRKELLKLQNFTLMLDESSLIQNETSKRSRFILKLKPRNVILLSGTPTGGKYEKLWSQMHLLGWDISKKLYWNQYVNVEYLDLMEGKSIPVVTGYKNVDRLKRKMAEHGCQFLKTDEVFDLPDQVFQKIRIPASKEYKKFHKDRIITIEDETLVGDTTLTKMLYERELCGQFSKAKLKAFTDLVESTEDRLIVFYNFTEELERMQDALLKIDFHDYSQRFSVVNGQVKALQNYEDKSNSITFIQYQAGAMGLNLQKASRMIFFTLPLSSELYEQAKKRIHRIGQNKPCFYYQMICKGTVEEKILKTLEMRKDYTRKLFEKG